MSLKTNKKIDFLFVFVLKKINSSVLMSLKKFKEKHRETRHLDIFPKTLLPVNDQTKIRAMVSGQRGTDDPTRPLASPHELQTSA